MVLPTTELYALIVLIVSAICWGSWLTTHKAAGKWRFELYYYDFSWGVVIAAVALVFTAGQWTSDELTWQDNLLLTGYRKIAWAGVAGAIGNLGTLLLLGASSVSRLTVVFPVCFGVSYAALSVWSYFAVRGLNPLFAFGGAGVLLLAAILAVLAFDWYLSDAIAARIRKMAADAQLKGKPFPKKPKIASGIVLAAVGGLFLAGFQLAMEAAGSQENGLASYNIVLFASVGMFFSSALYVLFFMNFPVQGDPLHVKEYFDGAKKAHALGILGGIIWTLGVLGPLLLDDLDVLPLDRLTAFLAERAVPLVGFLLGFFVWREYRSATTRVYMVLVGMLFCLCAGLVMVGMAPEL